MFPELVDGFVAALTGGLATRAGEGAAAAASGAFSSLVQTVRRRLGADPGTSQALAVVEQAPQDQGARVALVDALLRVCAEDPEFAEQFRGLWQRAQTEIHAEGGGVASQFTGSGTGLTQAGRDVTINYLTLPGEQMAPRQVPAFVGQFINRVSELSALQRHLTADPGGVSVVMLVGMPGVGKTALTSRGVSMLGNRFPGGQVHVDFAALSGRSGGAAMSEAAAKALRAVGVDEQFLPGRLAHQVELFQSRTAGRPPMLMVLEGVTDPAQVWPLVPSAAGSAVVVTTEYRLADLVKEGARMIEVKPLPNREAISLLADMCGDDRVAAEPTAAETVVRWCGGLAEALRVAGARLALDTTLTVAELAEELTEESRRLDSPAPPGWAALGVDDTVAAAFGVSYGRLPEDARLLYLGLGGVPLVECTVQLAAALIGAAAPAARAALETLAEASLLERTAKGRFRMHSLVRLHAARQAAVDRPDDGPEALRRAVDLYLSFTAWADRAIMGDRLSVGQFDPVAAGQTSPFTGPRARKDALAAMEAERANLLVVVRAAADAGLDEPVWQLAIALTALYLNHRHHADWIETSRLAVETAQRRGRHDVVVRLSSVASRAYADLGDQAGAGAQIEVAGQAAKFVDDLALIASYWELKGRHLEEIDGVAAEAAYRQSLALNLEADLPRGAALVRYFLGRFLAEAEAETEAEAEAETETGRRAEAMALLLEAYEWLRVNDERMAARCLYSLGRARLQDGDLAQAGRDLHAAADTFAAEGLWHYEVPAREALADLARELGDRDGERREVRRALDIERAAGGLRVDQLRHRLDGLG